MTEIIGYYVWTEQGGYAFRNKLHPTREHAEAALASVVWHNRRDYEVRAVHLGSASCSVSTTTGDHPNE